MSEFPIERRNLLQATGTGVFATIEGVQMSSAEDRESINESVIFQEDFEDYSPGEIPPNFVLAGNENQKVTDAESATGAQSYQMNGSYGGCWEAIMRRELFEDDTVPGAIRIQGYFWLDDGEIGCHENRSGAVGWHTVDSSSWSEGSGARLLQFRPNGEVTSAGDVVGEYNRYEWTAFEVEYYADSDSSVVTHQCTIGNGSTEIVTRTKRDFENELSVLEMKSSDFTVFWDEIAVTEIEGEDPGPEVGLVTGDTTNKAGDSLANITLEFVPTGADTPEETTTTDDSGNYEVELPADNYEVIVEEAGFEPTSIPVPVEDGETNTVDIELTPDNSSITISQVEVGPDSLLEGGNIYFVFVVGVSSDNNVGQVKIQRNGSTFEAQQITQVEPDTLNYYLVDLLGYESPGTTYEELIDAFEELLDRPASDIYAAAMFKNKVDVDIGDNVFDVIATTSNGSSSTEQVSLPHYAQGEQLGNFSKELQGSIINFSQEYFFLDHDITFGNELMPANLPVDLNIEILKVNLGYTGEGNLNLNSLEATAVDRATGGFSVFGKGIESQIGGEWTGSPSGYTYNLQMTDLWLALKLSFTVPGLSNLKLELPDFVPYLSELGISLDAMPGGYLLYGYTNPTDPDISVGKSGSDDGEFPLPDQREFNLYLTLIGSAGAKDIAEVFIDGTLHTASDMEFDEGAVIQPPVGAPLAHKGGELCLDGGIKIGKGPAEIEISIDTLADVTPGFDEPCVSLGETREPPCWEVFGIEGECQTYPGAESLPGGAYAFGRYNIEDVEPRLAATTGVNPPSNAVTAETETATVTRLTDRPERDASPVLGARQNEHLAVWERHQTDTAAEDGRDIVTATRDEAGWSEPTVITDTAGASYHEPAVAVADGDAAIAWTRYDLENTDGLDEVGPMTHIELVREEADGWSDSAIIEGTDEWFDSDPKVESLGDGWIVAWERSATGDNNSQALAYAVVDATGSVQRSETIGNASQLALATDTDAVALGYHDHDTHQIRRDLITESDRTQDVAYDVNDERAVGELAVSASGTVWTVADQTSTVGFYGEDSTVEQLEFVTAETRPQGLTLSETAIGTAVGYARVPDEDIRARSATYHVRANGEWRPAQVSATTAATAEDVTVRAPAVAPTTDGAGLLTLLGAKIHDPDAVHDLFAVEQPFRPSYAITADAGQNAVSPGEEMTVSYTIENTGDLDGDAIGDDPVLVEARSQGETLAEQQETPLARGETATGELTFTVDETGTVDIVVGRDLDLLDPEERRTTLEASSPLLAVDSVAVERPDGGTAIATIQIRNSGPVDADGFGIEVYGGDDTLLGEAQVAGPAAGERSSVTVEYDPSEIALAGGEQIHIDPEEELPDSHVTERVSPVLLGQPDIMLDSEVGYSETDSGAVAYLGLTNTGPVSTQVIVRAVWADATPEDGSFADEDLLGTKEVDLSAAIAGTPQSENVAVELEGVAYGDELRFIVEPDRSVAGAGIPVVYDRVGPFGPEIPALPGFENSPKDLDNDTLYEDIDGDGSFDIFDVQALFNGLENDAVQNNPEAFNFNEDDNPEEVTIFDVQGLFEQLGGD